MQQHRLRAIAVVLPVVVLFAAVSLALIGGRLTASEQRPTESPSTAFGTPVPRDNPPASPAVAPTGATKPLALGVFVPGMASEPSRIDAFAALVGVHPSIVMWYQPWSAGGTFYADVADAVHERGATPLVTWEPWDGTATNPAWTLQTILDGTHDAYIRHWAQGAAAWGRPIYVRLMHEMNGTWSAWSPGINGNSVADFVPAWRHIVDLVRAEGATNIQWVWCPNIDTGNPRYTPYADMYPGDDYVDWAALDGFNWGKSQGSGGKWFEIKPLFQASIDQLRSVTSKPLMIAETASAEEGGDKAAWIRDGLGRINELLPDVRAVIWFHTYEARTDVNWSVDSSVASLRAFREVVSSGLLSGTLP